MVHLLPYRPKSEFGLLPEERDGGPNVIEFEWYECCERISENSRYLMWDCLGWDFADKRTGKMGIGAVIGITWSLGKGCIHHAFWRALIFSADAERDGIVWLTVEVEVQRSASACYILILIMLLLSHSFLLSFSVVESFLD